MNRDQLSYQCCYVKEPIIVSLSEKIIHQRKERMNSKFNNICIDPQNSSRPMTRQVLCLMLVKLLKWKEFLDISTVLLYRARKFI